MCLSCVLGDMLNFLQRNKHHEFPRVFYGFRYTFSMRKFIQPINVKFVCVEVLRPSQPNEVMSSKVSLPSHTFSGQA